MIKLVQNTDITIKIAICTYQMLNAIMFILISLLLITP